MAAVIASRGKPFADGEYMYMYIKQALVCVSETSFSDLKDKGEIMRRLKHISLSDKTINIRCIDMSEDVES